MPGQKRIKSSSWLWFRQELARRLGDDKAAELLAELQRRRRLEYDAKQRAKADAMLARLEAQLDEALAAGRATKRIENAIEHWRKVRDGG